MNIIYRFIYNSSINKLLRNSLKSISFLIPKSLHVNPAGKIKLDLKNGRKIILITNQTSHITKLLFWNGVEKFEYSVIFLKLIQKIDSFYDIGANIGYYSLIGAKSNPKLIVEAFEPSPGVIKVLRENIKINNLENRIKINDIALSDKMGEVEFNEIFNPKYPQLPNLSGEHNMGTKSLQATSLKVRTDTLDNFYRDRNNLVDLIKIDTEGVEDLILKNSNYLIETSKPIIICETLFNKIEKNLEEIMFSHGYHLFNHKGKYLEKVQTIQRIQDNQIRNCFFVHPSKFHLIEEFLKP